MTSRFDKLCRIAAISTLAIAPLTFSISPARAKSLPTIGDVTNRTTTIAGHRLQILPHAESTNDDNSRTDVRQQSMTLVASGYEAEEAGNKELALENYYKAVQIDANNGWPYLLAGRLLGNNEIGIKCLHKALELFTAEHDRRGYKLALELLQAAS